MYLDKIKEPKDLKKLNYEDKNKLCLELREEILKTVSNNGGHLASNLGVVELTVALLSSFNLPKDKIIWDVGHQAYSYKLLTGRYKEFSSLRKLGGIAGFPRSEESQYDLFDTGHSSTSVSLALGLARSRDILKTNEKIIAVIGDGALTNGLALAAINDAGVSKTDLIVILNDNKMSISKNTGGVSKLLSTLRTRKFYIKINDITRRVIIKIPVIGKHLYNLISGIKRHIKGLLIKNMYFENLGFTYLGPVNGHNISQMESTFKNASNLKGPILIHVITKKGKGYSLAEKDPSKYHATGKFNLDVGIIKSNTKTYSNVFGDELSSLAKDNKKIVAITAAMEDGTGLNLFKKKYPKRFFDVEISEEHALTMAAGMAKGGLIPVVPIYSSFLQRGYDEIFHDICLNNLHVVIIVDRAGITGSDGTTHQGILDISYLNTIPNLTIMAPCNFAELRLMIRYAIAYNGPIAIRYPKGEEETFPYQNPKIEKNKSVIIQKGNDITIVAVGKMVKKALEVSKRLNKDHISTCIINARFIKPLDITTIKESFKNTNLLVTLEDNINYSGFGSIITNYFDKSKVLSLGYPDTFIEHGSISELEKKYHLDEESIYQEIITFYQKNTKS